MVRAKRSIEREAWRRMAQQTSWLLSPWSKKPPTAKQLLGEEKQDPEAALAQLVEGPQASVDALDQALEKQRRARDTNP